jgi:hypothetical protein
MRTGFYALVLLVGVLTCGAKLWAQNPRSEQIDLGLTSGAPGGHSLTLEAQTPRPALSTNEIIERILKREPEEDETISGYAPIIETYIQEQKSDSLMGTLPKTDVYFLGQADFRGGRLRVHSMTEKTHKWPGLRPSTWPGMWSYDPAGFLQMVFLDWGAFNKNHYRFTPAGREFLGDVRCYVFDVNRGPKAKGPRFVGRIWVEDQDFTIVRMNGSYTPQLNFSARHYQNEIHVHFDSWRTNVQPGMWLPSEIYSQEVSEPVPNGGPRFKARTHLWGYSLTGRTRQDEMGRILVESAAQVKDEAAQLDRSPLEQQRGWRHEAETNVMEVLERDGLAAPQGDLDKVLCTIVNNLIVTNHLGDKLDLTCRVLMTSNLELFSVHNTIVLSRGLIDVVPNEETLAALLAYEVADAMVPKPAQDQYGFSDILRLKPTEALKKLSFVDKPEEAAKISEMAVELLKNSPYGAKMANAGLFLSQLQSERSPLKQLISPRLGNQVHFTARLLQLAPPLDPGNVQQIGALPMGSRIKLNPWNDSMSLMKPQQMAPISPREKIPFEVTPINLHLTRYVQTSDVEHTIVPRSAIPVASGGGRE